ncbi:MAG: hypothetical protein JNK87_24525 [Bryobacterales bacterium]|nr:hypothetical protein [Bryobacterales bacterium]
MEPASFAVLVVMFFLTLAIIWYRLRVERWKHEERMAMIEKGVSPLLPPSRAHRYSLWGQLFLLVGLALLVVVLGYGFGSAHYLPEADKFARMQEYQKEKVPPETLQRIRRELDETRIYDIDPSAAWFALLPCTIGIGYLLMARMERRRE